MKLKSHNKRAGRAIHSVGPAFLAVVLAAFLAGCSGASSTQEDGRIISSSEISAQGEGLVISVGDITETPSFYPVTVGKTEMEIIAVKAPDGTIRTAFNTCQICYSSGRGYYKLSGDKLVCQNCGNRFSTSQIEVESGGCNPWPIFDQDKTVTGTDITISQNFLEGSVKIFSNWK